MNVNAEAIRELDTFANLEEQINRRAEGAQKIEGLKFQQDADSQQSSEEGAEKERGSGEVQGGMKREREGEGGRETLQDAGRSAEAAGEAVQEPSPEAAEEAVDEEAEQKQAEIDAIAAEEAARREAEREAAGKAAAAEAARKEAQEREVARLAELERRQQEIRQARRHNISFCTLGTVLILGMIDGWEGPCFQLSSCSAGCAVRIGANDMPQWHALIPLYCGPEFLQDV